MRQKETTTKQQKDMNEKGGYTLSSGLSILLFRWASKSLFHITKMVSRKG